MTDFTKLSPEDLARVTTRDGRMVMRSSEILREAARRVESGISEGGCLAIMLSECSLYDKYRAREVFRHFYRKTSSGFWWPRKPAHGPRIIGLCLAAAIAESEGD